MIEKKLVQELAKEFEIQEFVTRALDNVGHSHTKLMRTPLGEKIVIFSSRPGLIVGKKGENIKKLTGALKKKFKLENPQIEIAEVESPMLDADIVAENIASSIERFGVQKFKAIAHKVMQDVIHAGAAGIEVIISGKVPSQRAKSWRFFNGYLSKCGEFAVRDVKRAIAVASLKAGTIGIKVRIMPGDLVLPDNLEVKKILDVVPEKKVEAKVEAKVEEKKEAKPKKARKPKAEAKVEVKAEPKPEVKEEVKDEN